MLKEGFKSISALPDLGWGKPIAVIGGADVAPETFGMLKEMDVTTVCCDKALPRVLPYYRPKFVTALNTQKTEAVELEKWFADSEDMSLIVPVTVHPKTIELWKGDVYWMNPTNIHEDLQMRIEQETGIQPTHRGLNVGEFSLLMAGFMRPAEIAMFGIWYAWKNEEDVLDDPLPDSYSVVKLVDKGETWYTNITWLSSRATFLEFCKSFHTQGVEVFNCSMGGILYHPEYCKEMTPKEFKERWQDGRGTGLGIGTSRDENDRDGAGSGKTNGCTSDDMVRLPELRGQAGNDEKYGGD